MKTQKSIRMIQFCLPVVMVVVWGGPAPSAQEKFASVSCVVLQNNPQVESTASLVISGRENVRPKRFSWKAEPLPKCKSFLITEFGLGYTAGYNFYLSGDLGLMVNKNEHSARGLILSYRASSVAHYGIVSRIGLKPRFRRWLGQKSSLDLSPGLVYKMDERGNNRSLGVLGEVGLNLLPWLALTSQLEIIPKGRLFPLQYGGDERKTYVGFDVGFKMGGKPGTIIAAVSAALIGLGALLASSIDSIQGPSFGN